MSQASCAGTWRPWTTGQTQKLKELTVTQIIIQLYLIRLINMGCNDSTCKKSNGDKGLGKAAGRK